MFFIKHIQQCVFVVVKMCCRLCTPTSGETWEKLKKSFPTPTIFYSLNMSTNSTPTPTATTSTPTTPNQAQISKRIACQECRQQKVKCDAQDNQSCTRCRKKNIECLLVPDFKRTFKRKRMVEVELEIEKLLGKEKELPKGEYQPVDVSAKNTPDAKNDWEHSAVSITIDKILLSADQINVLFATYVNHYHPYFPILQYKSGPKRLHNTCPTLFWTIMTVATRRQTDLHQKLSESLRNLLIQSLAQQTLWTVQAFLINAHWPPLTSSLSSESSWSMVGHAMYGAVRTGLHYPRYSRDFGRIKQQNPDSHHIETEKIEIDVGTMKRTWVACNYAAMFVASILGYPAFSRFEMVKQETGLWGTLVELGRYQSEVSKTLQMEISISLIQLLHTKLDDLEAKFVSDPHSGIENPVIQFSILFSRVQVLTYTFLIPSLGSHVTDLNVQKSFLKLYTCSLSLIHHAYTYFEPEYLPSMFLQTIWQTACVACRIFHSKALKPYLPVDSGRQYFDHARTMVLAGSVLPHDLMYRASEIMTQLWRLYQDRAETSVPVTATVPSDNGTSTVSRTNNIEVLIRSRMSASVFFDCLWTLKEEQGIRSDAPVILQPITDISAETDNLKFEDAEVGIDSIKQNAGWDLNEFMTEFGFNEFIQ